MNHLEVIHNKFKQIEYSGGCLDCGGIKFWVNQEFYHYIPNRGLEPFNETECLPF